MVVYYNLVLLCLSSFVVFGVCKSYDDVHDHDTGHSHYPVIIPKNAYHPDSGSFATVHSAVNSEIGNEPKPTTSPSIHDHDHQEHEDHDPQHNQHEDYTQVEKDGKLTRNPLEPRVQKYGYPIGCLEPNYEDVAIEHTKCHYMVVITIKQNLRSKEKDNRGYANYKISRILDEKKPNGYFGYVSVGLSLDNYMGDDHFVACVKVRQARLPTLYHAWSKFHTAPMRLEDDAQVIIKKYENFDPKTKALTCEFERPLVSEVHVPDDSGHVMTKVFDLTKVHYKILLAVGPTDRPDSEKLGYHGRPTTANSSNEVFDPLKYDSYFYKSSGSTYFYNSLLCVLLVTLSLAFSM